MHGLLAMAVFSKYADSYGNLPPRYLRHSLYLVSLRLRASPTAGFTEAQANFFCGHIIDELVKVLTIAQ